MSDRRSMKAYKAELDEALEDKFLRETLDNFAVAYRESRKSVFAGINAKELIAEIAAAKDESLAKLDELYAGFKKEAEKRGAIVHLAATAEEANEIICRIAKENGCRKIIKSKSMTSEETQLNHALLENGLEVTETDLGEWIIQLRHERPSHMVMPAIHLSRVQVADLFTRESGREQKPDIERLVKVARSSLRDKFVEADMGISGANFAVAQNGAIGLCSNEGNAGLVSTLPRVHVALCGLDKLMPTMRDALRVIRALPRNATGQAITSYVNWISGATECSLNANGRKIMHIVFLDNGRAALAKDPVCGEALRCVRCGACANVCPVYRLVGGHKMGHIYIGAIGLILTYFFHGADKAGQLAQNCINCDACKDVCAAGINLPAIIQEIRARLNRANEAPAYSKLMARVLANRSLFHSLLKMGRWAQRPVTGGTRFVRHLPQIFVMGQDQRAIPAIADKSFRQRWPLLKQEHGKSGPRVAIFAGCAQDFIYPEQLEAALKLLYAKGCRVEFPLEQSCCGLPLQSMGERSAAIKTAQTNIAAFKNSGCEHIITLCASCASHMRHGYPRLLAGEPEENLADMQNFIARVKDFSSFLVDTLGYGDDDFANTGGSAAYHASCHICRGLGITEQPRALIRAAGTYCKSEEEDLCCGFGGVYSVKFPAVSTEILHKKLSAFEASGTDTVVTECPGCILQLRGGEEKRGNSLRVMHMSEFLAARIKK